MARFRRGPGAMLRGALDIQLGREIMKVFGAGAPWVLMLFIMPILSIVSYLLWHAHGFIILPMFIGIAALLSFWELRMTHVKSSIGKAIRLLTINFWVFWLGLATIHPLWTRPTLDIFMVGGALLCIMSNMRTFTSRDDESAGAINWNVIDEKAGLDGKTKFKQLPGVGKTIRGMVKLKDGMTPKQLMNSGDAIKAVAGLPANGLRFTPNPDNSSEVEISFVTEDILRHDVDWVKSAYAGQSIAAGPIQIGVYEDGHPAFVHLYSPAGAKHLIISGMNGSGKSVGARNILADAMLRTDVRIFAVDVAKGSQTLGPMLNGLDLFFTDQATGNVFLTRMKTVIKERADYLGKKQLDAWEPGCGLDFLILIIEEGASFVNDSDDFIRVVETARSAGVAIILSIQRASHTNMPTDARAQFASALCFGVEKEMDARFVLSDDLIERGADPSVWKANKMGYAYLEGFGVDTERHAIPLKTMKLTSTLLRDACAEVVDRDVDDFTRQSIGELYKEKHNKMDMKVDKAETEDQRAEAEVTALKAQFARENGEFEEEEITEFDEKMIFESGDEGPAFVFGEEPATKMSPVDARAAFDRHLARLSSEGKRTFAVRDLYPVLEETGRVRTWIHVELNRRKNNGSVSHDSEEGTYTIISTSDNIGELVE